ncbi:DUF1810 domain-containing protein [Massilia sp. RP-1-19]|uniref:DUF1810 domain-containing protein n=1 Tax=Massilia polaris TaxID=2728846 RepID=A0A848HK69_9BURK|nr:DUF1810 domain-containing protein [Massilia polaris]NML59653.1 DUF1810 domain-containing protein [Massilia polaris]
MQAGFKLERFERAQAPVYEAALGELRAGRKRSHWMWFIFPQVAGLGHSEMAQHYAIASLDEAAAYLAHPVLGPRLRECCQVMAASDAGSASDIFGYPDDVKFHSSLTLFAQAAPGEAVFRECLDQYFDGQPDANTLSRLKA